MKTKIIVGVIDLSFHKVTAGVFHIVLEHFGFEVQLIYKTHEEIFNSQQNNQIDLLISAWLPGSHGKYLEPYAQKIKTFNPIYAPYCIWGIPKYLSQKGLSSIEDLIKPEFHSIVEKNINGIGMGAGISRFSLKIIEEYGLGSYGYNFIHNLPDDFSKIIEDKLENKKNIIIPLWHPQYLHNIYELYPLKDPKGLLQGQDLATPILLKESIAKFTSEELAVLSKISLGNQAISQMDYSYNKENYSAKEAALKWIIQKFDSISNYINYLKKEE